MAKHYAPPVAGARHMQSQERPDLAAMMYWLVWADLPPDISDCECSEVILFKASVFLNYVTGGHPAMTFSARTYMGSRISRNTIQRSIWIIAAASIDAACATFRGETEHCATAWVNFVRRDPASKTLVTCRPSGSASRLSWARLDKDQGSGRGHQDSHGQHEHAPDPV